MPTKRKWLVVLFLCGAATHLLLLRLIAHWDYHPPTSRAFIDHPFANAGLAALGGISVALFFFPLVRWARNPVRRRTLPILGMGVICGILATVIAEQVFLVLCGAYATIFIPSSAPFKMLGSIFLLWMIDIETYGIGYMIGWGPFDIAEGIAIAAIILVCTNSNQRNNGRFAQG